ncbi:Uncharacterised protein [Vibrio cholerae]|nr:Uncharacterised protein [Vibrio cholerae]
MRIPIRHQMQPLLCRAGHFHLILITRNKHSQKPLNWRFVFNNEDLNFTVHTVPLNCIGGKESSP